jgi:type 1 glutamine amidotransferase
MNMISLPLLLSVFRRKTPLLSLLLICALMISGCSARRSVGGGQKPGTIRVLMVGGGTSHNFDRWYRQADSITLTKDGLASVTYTSGIDSVLPLLTKADVLFLSTNQAMQDPNLRKAILDFVSSGKGLILAHAGTWYNNKEWPEFNSRLVGGGARSHERYGSFDFTINNPDHPVTKNVPRSFTLKDELYRMIPDSAGPGIEVLATATVPGTQTTYPELWVTKGFRGRIIGFTLGHDGESHDLAAYQTLIRNAVSWVAGRQ